MLELTLDEIKPGQKVKVVGIDNFPLKERLMSMGLVPGTAIDVLRSAPLGDPMAVRVRSYNLAMRLKDAARITVVLN